MIRAVDINAHADRVDHGETAQADKVLVRGNRVGRECGRSAGKEASPNFRAAGLGAMCLESPPCSSRSSHLARSSRVLFVPLICHLLQSRAPSTLFPRASLPLSSLFSLFLARFLRVLPSFSFASLALSFSLSLCLSVSYSSPSSRGVEHPTASRSSETLES